MAIIALLSLGLIAWGGGCGGESEACKACRPAQDDGIRTCSNAKKDCQTALNVTVHRTCEIAHGQCERDVYNIAASCKRDACEDEATEASLRCDAQKAICESECDATFADALNNCDPHDQSDFCKNAVDNVVACFSKCSC